MGGQEKKKKVKGSPQSINAITPSLTGLPFLP
jgi:hypothetical protein